MALLKVRTLNPDLVNDLIKTAAVLLVVELIQFTILGEPFLDNAFTRTAIQQLVGLIVYHTIVSVIITAEDPTKKSI
jgi:hypothetical protein